MTAEPSLVRQKLPCVLKAQNATTPTDRNTALTCHQSAETSPVKAKPGAEAMAVPAEEDSFTLEPNTGSFWPLSARNLAAVPRREDEELPQGLNGNRRTHPPPPHTAHLQKQLLGLVSTSGRFGRLARKRGYDVIPETC
ncbi:hypothetical protein AOLI_G00268700 [Acnodon oligacanthus]